MLTRPVGSKELIIRSYLPKNPSRFWPSRDVRPHKTVFAPSLTCPRGSFQAIEIYSGVLAKIVLPDKQLIFLIESVGCLGPLSLRNIFVFRLGNRDFDWPIFYWSHFILVFFLQIDAYVTIFPLYCNWPCLFISHLFGSVVLPRKIFRSMDGFHLHKTLHLMLINAEYVWVLFFISVPDISFSF